MFEKLERLKDDCLCELDSIDLLYKVGKNITWEIDKRSKRRLGVCRYNMRMGYTYHTIGISNWLLKDFDDKTIKNTIMHELIHTFEGCNNHGYEWQRYANMVNKKLGYNIKRLSNVQALCENNNINYEEFNNARYKYKITCKHCGNVHMQFKLSTHYKWSYINNHMLCGKCRDKHFIVEDMKEHKILCDN